MNPLAYFRLGYQKERARQHAAQQPGKRARKPGKTTQARQPKPRIGRIVLFGLAMILLACPWLLILGLAFLPRGGGFRGLRSMGGDINRDRS